MTLDDYRRAEAWKTRAIDAENERARAEEQLAAVREVVKGCAGHLEAAVKVLDLYMFGAAK